jgi:predicted TIM-barrel enzyme
MPFGAGIGFRRGEYESVIGSYFKAGGHWANPVEAERVKSLMTLVERIRSV